MANASSRIKTVFEGEDRTAATFKGVADKARETQKAMGGGFSGSIAASVASGQALFAVVAGIARKAMSAASELGTLSDRAQQMQTSAEYVQKLTGALNQAGVKNVSIDALTESFDKMTKATGRIGAEGFEKTLAELASMGDEQQRVIRLGEIFGKAMGPGLAPLLRQGPEAFKEGLAAVMAGMPAVSDAAVNAGDSMADAWAVANDEVKVGFQSMIGNVALYMKENFGMSMEEAIRTFVVNVKWGIGVGWAYFKAFSENIGMIAEFFVDDWKGALKWVFNGTVAYVKALWSTWNIYLETLGDIAREFGKAFVRWVTGDDADWSAAWDAAKAKLGEAGKELKDVWKDVIPTAPIGREWVKVDQKALNAQRQAALDTMRKSIAGKDMLASAGAAAGADVAEAGKKASNKISEALRDAKYVSANSYEAFKIAFAGRKAASASAMSSGSIGGASGIGKGTNEILPLLKEVLNLQRSGWKKLSEVGVV